MPSYQEPVPLTKPQIPRAMKRRLEKEVKSKHKKLAKLKPKSKHKKKLESEIADIYLLLHPEISRISGVVPSADRVAQLMKGGRCRHPRAIDVSEMYHQADKFARQLTEAEVEREMSADTRGMPEPPSYPEPEPEPEPAPAKKSHLSPDEEAMSELEEILGALYRDIPSFPAL